MLDRATVGHVSGDPFVTHRSLLFTIAYEMLGAAADAEDVVQQTWGGWVDVDHDEVRDPRAYLVRMVTLRALDRLRALSRQRETYAGPRLTEPLLTGPDVAEDVELAENVSIAMLTVLETLGPVERAVFVLREVFDVPHGEIAEVVGRTPAAVRQIARRAREHVAARRPRMVVGRTEPQAAVAAFRAAVENGDLHGLLDVLAPMRSWWPTAVGWRPRCDTRSPGRRAWPASWWAWPRPGRSSGSGEVWLNGTPALRVDLDGEVGTAITLAVAGARVTRIYAVRNPHKPSRPGVATRLTRTS